MDRQFMDLPFDSSFGVQYDSTLLSYFTSLPSQTMMVTQDLRSWSPILFAQRDSFTVGNCMSFSYEAGPRIQKPDANSRAFTPN